MSIILVQSSPAFATHMKCCGRVAIYSPISYGNQLTSGTASLWNTHKGYLLLSTKSENIERRATETTSAQVERYRKTFSSLAKSVKDTRTLKLEIKHIFNPNG